MKVVIALSVLAVVGTVTALKCFTCNSQTDSACNDLFNSDSPALQQAFIVDCDEKDGVTPFCRKVKYAIKNSSEYRVQRDCGYMRREGYDCYQKRSEDYVMDTCQCENDLCNNAPSLSTSVATMFAVAVPIVARFL
ncbi:UPAR/Ly6 domain-containing protein crok-like [Palaemon carinicauda]|uniref:UPAR/Ly6 domain-containing protein crok-like n=1 Tax=Palaemon carinicauda TaxID=392227 RepID=UPI0035B63FC8